MESFGKDLTFTESQISRIKTSANPYVEWLIQGVISRTRKGCQELIESKSLAMIPEISPEPSPPKPTENDSESDEDGPIILFPWEEDE